MPKSVVIYEFAVAVLGRHHNPTVLNPDFLKVNQIVPEDWEVAEPPICMHPVAQVVFRNTVRIVAQANKIVFSESLGPDGAGDIETPAIAACYLKTLPHVDYRAVGINPKAAMFFDSDSEAERWLESTFFAAGDWRTFEGVHAKSRPAVVYDLPNVRLQLNVDVGAMTVGEDTKHAVFFLANFHRDVGADKREDGLRKAIEVIESWQQDIQTLKRLVETRMLKETV